MVDSDDLELTSLSKNSLPYPDYHSLITEERTEKLDLLVHLIVHTNVCMVVCGPKGIGKTTLLGALQEQQSSLWQYFEITGSQDLDLESFQNEMQSQISAPKNGKKTVIGIDNSGLLKPGLITSILEFSAIYPNLSVIFSLTPDELFIKHSTDNLIYECKVIEIPVLSEKECGDFLQYLVTKPGMRLSADGFNGDSGTLIYQKTHGIPGNFFLALPKLSAIKKQDRTLAILITTVMVLVGITLGVQWLTQHPTFLNSHFPGHFLNLPNSADDHP